MADLPLPPMPFVDVFGLPSINPGHIPAGIEEEGKRGGQRGLIGFDRQEIVPAGVEDLLTEVPLTEQGVPGQHPAMPVNPLQQAGRDGKLGFGLVAPLLDRLTGQDHAIVMAEGDERMDRAAARLILEPSPVRLPIDGNALAAPHAVEQSNGGRKGRRGRGQRTGSSCRKRRWRVD